jgi:hypothetical protein
MYDFYVVVLLLDYIDKLPDDDQFGSNMSSLFKFY